MKNKILVLKVFVFMTFFQLSAQNNTNSPYSSKGFGEFESFNNAYTKSLGGVSNGIRSSRNFSFSNPASLGALKNVVFDFALRVDYTKVYNKTNSKATYNGNFNYFTLGFPVLRTAEYKKDTTIKDKLYKTYKTVWSTAIGFMPYSNTNSTYFREKDTVFGKTLTEYQIKGGLTRIFWTNAFNFNKNFSVGITSSFLYGQKNTSNSYSLVDSGISYSIFDINSNKMNGFQFNLGLQYDRNKDTFVRYERDSLGKIIKVKRYPIRFVVGGSFNNNNNINSTINRQILSIYTSIDTVLNRDNAKLKTRLPMTYSAGFGVTLNNKWMFAFDYQKTLLSRMDKNIFQDSFNNSTQFSFGLAYRPDMDVEKMTLSSGKNKKLNLEYRLGLRFNNTGINYIDNKGQLSPMKEYGISFGIGIPRISEYWDSKRMFVKSMINITGEYIHRGNSNNGLIAEDLWRLTIGFNLSDVWFLKRKYN